MSRPTQPLIRSYNLYGEQGELPDVIHCERVATRSRVHDWRFPPHRHPLLHQFFIMDRGGGRTRLDGTSYALAPMALVNIPYGVVHEYELLTGSDGYVLTLTSEAMEQALRAEEGLMRVLGQPAVLEVDAVIMQLFGEISRAFEGREYGRAQILRSLSGLLFARIAQAIIAVKHPSEFKGTPTLWTKFEALVDDNFPRHWRVRDYAKALSVSPAHLSRVVREATGRPATRVIEERLVREARRLLAYTPLTISQVAYELGFEDPAYFSRVFARATGLSPRAFRERAEEVSG